MSFDQILAYAGGFVALIGPTGSFLELIGNTFKMPALVAFGQKLENLGADILECFTFAKAKAARK